MTERYQKKPQETVSKFSQRRFLRLAGGVLAFLALEGCGRNPQYPLAPSSPTRTIRAPATLRPTWTLTPIPSPTETLQPTRTPEQAPANAVTLTRTPEPTQTTTPAPTETKRALRPIISLEGAIPEEIKKPINDATLMVIHQWSDGMQVFFSGIHVGDGWIVTCRHGVVAPDGERGKYFIGHPDYRFFEANLAYCPENSEDSDIALLQYDTSQGGYGQININWLDTLEFNQRLVIMDYQVDLQNESSDAIHYHEGAFLGETDGIIFVVEGIDPEAQGGIKNTSGGASGGGLYLVKEGKPYLIGSTMGDYYPEDVKQVMEIFGGEYQPGMGVAVFTDVNMLPEDYSKLLGR